MKKLILQLLFFILIAKGFCQNPSYIKWITSPQKELPQIFSPIYNDLYLFSYRQFEPNNEEFKNVLYIVDEYFNYHDSVILYNDNYIFNYSHQILFKDNDSILLHGVATQIETNTNYKFLHLLNTNLETLWKRILTEPASPSSYSTVFCEPPSFNLVFYQNYPHNYPMHWRYSWSGDILNLSIDQEHYISNITTINKLSNGNFIHIGYQSDNILIYDSLFNFQAEAQYSIPYESFNLYNIEMSNDQYFLIGNYASQVTFSMDIISLRINTLGNILGESVFGVQDTFDIAGQTSFINNFEYYIGGVKNNVWYTGEPFPELSWYQLIKTNLSGDTIFQKFYGGDMFHNQVYNLEVMPDNGCLMVGSSWDYINYPEGNWDIIILRVDENGGITNIQDQQNILIADAIVYPNPGKDIINIRSGLANYTFMLYDMNGKKLFTGHFKLNGSINVSEFPAGTYSYTIHHSNGNIDSGIWLKK